MELCRSRRRACARRGHRRARRRAARPSARGTCVCEPRPPARLLRASSDIPKGARLRLWDAEAVREAGRRRDGALAEAHDAVHLVCACRGGLVSLRVSSGLRRPGGRFAPHPSSSARASAPTGRAHHRAPNSSRRRQARRPSSPRPAGPETVLRAVSIAAAVVDAGCTNH